MAKKSLEGFKKKPVNKREENLTNFLAKIYTEDARVKSDFNMLCGYVWQFEGATQEMEFSEFIAGLMSERFSSQKQIFKIKKRYENGQLH